MKKKSLLQGLAVLAVTIGLAACSSGNSSDKSSDSSTPSEQTLYQKIKKSGVIKIGTEGTYSPYSYHNDQDKLVGYDVEIAKAVAKKLGVKAEFVEAPWDSMLAAFDAGKSDVVFNQVGITDERKEKYSFSDPYTVSHAVLITNEDNKDIKSFEDLKGKNSAQSLTSNYATIAESYGATIVSTDGFSKSVELVISNRADATLNDDVTFYDYKKQKPDAPIKIVATSDEASQNAALVKKGNDDLVDAINKALKELKDEGKIKEISEKYFDKDISE